MQLHLSSRIESVWANLQYWFFSVERDRDKNVQWTRSHATAVRKRLVSLVAPLNWHFAKFERTHDLICLYFIDLGAAVHCQNRKLKSTDPYETKGHAQTPDVALLHFGRRQQKINFTFPIQIGRFRVRNRNRAPPEIQTRSHPVGPSIVLHQSRDRKLLIRTGLLPCP